jgi:CRISPR/Cas system-associated protein Cas7 (RAMP superfamily)
MSLDFKTSLKAIPLVELHFYLKFGSSHPVKEDPSFVCDNYFQILKNKKNNVTKITQIIHYIKFDVVQEREILVFIFYPFLYKKLTNILLNM